MSQKSLSTKPLTTTHALKEWAVAVEALEKGKTIMLLRKGGIRERQNRFSADHKRVLLYPTYEHQKPNLLKPEYAHKVNIVKSSWHPETVRISSWAEITEILKVQELAILNALLPHHIWNQQLVSQRFQWKAQQPLYILLLRIYQLAQPMEIPYQSKYGGCRSWIQIIPAISLQGGKPVLTDSEYNRQVTHIRQIVQTHT